MGLLDTVMGLFGASNKKSGVNPAEMLKDGKIDTNDIKEMVTEQFDTNKDGKLDLGDVAGNLDVNKDGKTDLNDLAAAKGNFKPKR